MKSVLLLGSYGRGNIGDDAFLIAATNLLWNSHVAINASNDAPLPESVQQKVTVISTNGSKDVLQKLRILIAVSAIVYGGGDLWVELIGDKRPRQALWKMLLLNLAARILGKKVFYIGCGAGKLEGFSLKLARLSARLADGIILRDEATRKTLELPSASVLPDLTITLFPQPPELSMLNSDKPIKLVVSTLYYIPDPELNFENYIQQLANCINQLDPTRFEITLLPMLTAQNTLHNDIWASERLLERLTISHHITISYPKSFQEFKQTLASAHLVIGSRLHANILATWLGKPSIGIAYRPKVRRFFSQNDMVDNCLDLDEINKLPSLITQIINNYDAYAQQAHDIWKKNTEKGKVYEQFVQTNL